MTGIVEQILTAPAWLTLLVVFALPALESSAFLGFVFPGEAAVLIGGASAGIGHVPLAAVIAAAICGALLGDAIGYLVGRRWGRRLLDSTFGRFVKREHIDRAEESLRRRGVWAVVLGRFTAVLRVMIPGLAGMAQMPPRRFLAANAVGGVSWAVLVAGAGYLAGASWQVAGKYVAGAGWAVTVFVILGFGLVSLVRHTMSKRHEQAATAAQVATREEDRR